MNNNIKVIICGDMNVGKTSIILKSINDKFNNTYNPTIGVDYFTILHKNTKISIWDLSGDKYLKTITDKYFYGKDVVIFVYSINEIESLTNIKYLYNSYIQNELIKNEKIIIVCNKLDLIDNYNKNNIEEGSDWAKNIQADFIIVSAKNGNNIKVLLNMIVDTKKEDILTPFLTQKIELKQKKHKFFYCNLL